MDNRIKPSLLHTYLPSNACMITLVALHSYKISKAWCPADLYCISMTILFAVCLVLCLPRVHIDGEISFHGHLHLPLENGALHVLDLILSLIPTVVAKDTRSEIQPHLIMIRLATPSFAYETCTQRAYLHLYSISFCVGWHLAAMAQTSQNHPNSLSAPPRYHRIEQGEDPWQAK